jgi:hypothetical protein
MASSGIPSEPLASPVTCPRCGKPVRRNLLNIDGTHFRCSGCEWQFTPGLVTVGAAPGVPASGTATTNLVTNTKGSIVIVTLSTFTLTFVYVNGVQVGTTNAAYAVPAGGTISVTYSVAGTWTWVLPTSNGSVAAGALALPIAAGGAAFTSGEQLYVSDGALSEIVTVGPSSTGTSIVIAGNGFANAHGTGKSFGDLVLTSAYSGVGVGEAVPAPPGWGF